MNNLHVADQTRGACRFGSVAAAMAYALTLVMAAGPTAAETVTGAAQSLPARAVPVPSEQAPSVQVQPARATPVPAAPVTATVGTSPTAQPSESAAGAPAIAFNIPEQPLSTALQAFSASSGVAVLYRAEVGSAFRSPAIVGDYTREAALRLLLSSTDLIVRYARADAITLIDPGAAAAADTPGSVLGGADLVLDTLHVATPSAVPGPDRAALASYFDAIQQEVHRALKQSRVAPGGGFQVEVDLWVEPSRVIRRAQIRRSTGDRDRDAAVALVLEGLTLRQAPPARTPNPIRVKIVVTGT